MTGHTGFKGSWMSLWLSSMGAIVRGLSLPPAVAPNLFDIAQVRRCLEHRIVDIRDFGAVCSELGDFQPEILIHMAAQPLVRFSYQDPLGTYSTNVMGTINVLEAARRTDSVKTIVNVTSDKCYENKGTSGALSESEPMGGRDPYSSSKGCSELASRAYRDSFFSCHDIGLATARAGNVIGGGDWSSGRLVPDVLCSLEKNEPLLLRNPDFVRPWQHVLEPVSGYLLLAELLYLEGTEYAEGWNFGPSDSDQKSVAWVADFLYAAAGRGSSWTQELKEQPWEAASLRLDSSKSQRRLNWQPRWSIETTLRHTLEWHQNWLAGHDMKEECLMQIQRYETGT